MKQKISVFHGSIGNRAPTDLVLTHLSTSKSAAAERIGSLFTGQSSTRVNSDGSVDIIDPVQLTSVKRTLKDHIEQFCSYLERCQIHEFELDISSPLRVEDLWEDDPIGSGGVDIVSPSSLSDKEEEQVKNIFSPYQGVIYPHSIRLHCTDSDIKKIKKSFKSNRLFRRELRKRYERAKAIGDHPANFEINEHVWLDLTFKFRDWALENGYDSLVYRNDKEGSGADCYVLLRENSRVNPVRTFNIDLTKYINEVPSRLGEYSVFAMQKAIASGKTPTSFLWADIEPHQFWI